MKCLFIIGKDACSLFEWEMNTNLFALYDISVKMTVVKQEVLYLEGVTRVFLQFLLTPV